MLAAFAEDIYWHVPGRGPLSGDYRGHAEVLGFFEHFLGLADEGSFSIRIDDVLAKGDRVIVLCTESATRNGRSWSSPQVHAWTIRDEKASVWRQFQGDQQTEDEFCVLTISTNPRPSVPVVGSSTPLGPTNCPWTCLILGSRPRTSTVICSR